MGRAGGQRNTWDIMCHTLDSWQNGRPQFRARFHVFPVKVELQLPEGSGY